MQGCQYFNAVNSAIAGLDKATAQKILKVWEQTGAGSSPDALRKMLINRSLRTLGTVLLQVALDTGVSVNTHHACSW